MRGELGSIEGIELRCGVSLTAVDVKAPKFQSPVQKALVYTSRPQSDMPGIPCTLMSPSSRAATQPVIKQIIHAPSSRYSSIAAIVLSRRDSNPPSSDNKHLLASDHLVGYRLVNIVTVVKEGRIAMRSPREQPLRATLTVACLGLADTCRALAGGCLADATILDAVKDKTVTL